MVDQPNGGVVLYDDPMNPPIDFFGSRQEAEDYIDLVRRLDSIAEKVRDWSAEVTKELDLDFDEVLEGVQLAISDLLVECQTYGGKALVPFGMGIIRDEN